MAYANLGNCGGGRNLYGEDLGDGEYRNFCIEDNKVTSVTLYYRESPCILATKEIKKDGPPSYFFNARGLELMYLFEERPLEFFSKEVQEWLNKPVNLEELPPHQLQKAGSL